MSKKTRKRPRQSFATVVSNNWFALKKVAHYTPGLFVLMFVEILLIELLAAAGAYFNYFLLNEVSAADGSFARAAIIIGVMAVAMLALYGLDKWFWFVFNGVMSEKLHMKMHEELFRKAQQLDLACFDDPEFYNDFVWAMDESRTRALQVVQDTATFIGKLVGCTSLVGLMLSIDPLIAVVLLVSSVISIVCESMANRLHYDREKEIRPLWRVNGYINRVFHLGDYAKEIRISDAEEMVMEQYAENNVKIIDCQYKYGRKYYLLYGLGFGMMELLTFYGTLLYMIFKLKAGVLAIGGFAAAIQVIWNIRWHLLGLVRRIINFPNHSLYIEKWREFLHFEPRVTGEKTDLPPFESLELRNVSFAYEFSAHPKYRFREDPSSNECREALRNVNLTIRAGDKVAIVGYNGAGKTTLIKLMMRLYDPTEGVILYNGVDIREYDPAAYRKHIGTVFQDYRLFATSIAYNVMNGDYDEAAHRETVLSALDKSDFTDKLKTLSDGIDTHLTREFREDGTNLSGGEAQKVAIARVFAADYPIVIMDEPSSALDPMAEYQLNQSILHHTQDKTVVFISHRLSTTRIADTIYMFEKGALVEQGSHEALLAQEGKYAEMFHLQAEKYEGSGADGNCG